ncbi:uncharacterized protein Pyn_25375 [Prunus yedoensis var. nudiflora]|uniref:Zinc finger PHD-type domain-containing protein n=1 Tax=Prunus yedoensis var. nudiflora TaxID=2094558 RepID=A0A314UXJ5_PRUYE|nr:uncharacterized protein Pyn_25375 [Prunus yedoensis var. nudiflora]
MSCRKERVVDELYNATRIVMKPEALLRGSHRMQGPADETDHDIKKNMVSSQSIKEFGKHSMSRKVHMRGESGACNLCSAPCSSCVHFNRALMGSKADEFSDETCRVNAASQYSINVGDTTASFKSKACDSLQHTTSETSNLLSVNSSHDSLSENAESKAPIRSSDTSDAVEGFEMLTNTFEDSKVAEVNDDNISCISRVNDANLAVNHHNRNVERKNLSCSFASVGSVDPEEVEKAHKSVLSETIKAADAGDSAPKGKLPECSGNTDSSLIKESPSDIVTRQKFDSNTGLGASTKICPKTEVETNGNGQDLNDEALTCLDHGEQDVKSNELVTVADKQPLQSASGDDSDESDIVEHDVKVCDICGDAGREDMLAMCSRCSDGAEHIYCMRKMLRRVPKGQWLCEECKFAEEADNQKQGSDMEGKRLDKAILSTQFSNKRLAENIEVAPAAKRQALEIRGGSPRPSSPKRMGALSRESSFKSIDKDRLRSTYQSSQSINDISEAARSPSSGIRLQTTKVTLLKSNSFNTLTSKPRVKTVDDVLQKQKGSKEHSSLDMKERVARMMGKSVSFKSSRGETSLLSSVSNNRESKVVLPDGKLSTIAKSIGNLTRKGVEPQNASVGGSSTNGICNSASEQKSNQVSSKDEPLSSYSGIVEKPCSNVDETLEDVFPQSVEMTSQADKTRESSARCRHTVTASPKCKDIGYTAESCRVGISQASGTDASYSNKF